MKPCPPPDGSLLPTQHRPFFVNLLRALIENEFRKSKLDPLLPKLVDTFSQLCSTGDDWMAWRQELSLWVRWYRVPAFWLTFIFQQTTRAANSPYHFLACDLYSQAQTNFADDLALSSLETAYEGYFRNRKILGSAFDPVRRSLENRLRVHYNYYYDWSRPFEYKECNPCADHLYTQLSLGWLAEGAAPDEGAHLDTNDAGALSEVIGLASGREYAYYRVLARRFLGLLHAGRGLPELAAQQFQPALEEARGLRMDTEIGHLRRLLGLALRALGKLDEARHHFEQAYAFERLEPFLIYTTYWQAISARELGDAILHHSGRAVGAPTAPEDVALVIEDPEKLRPALNAYHDGRMLLNGHLTLQCPVPIARAAKQQIFRSYSNNAIYVAAMLGSSPDLLAEVELNGPREATEVAVEIAAARENPQVPLAEFRRGRARYYKSLGPVKRPFEQYLEDVAEDETNRRAYIEQSLGLNQKLMELLAPDHIAEQILKLRLPDTIFLLFHLGAQSSYFVLIDMSSGLAAPFPIAISEHDLKAIQDEYMADIQAAPDGGQEKAALDKYLSRCADIVGPAFQDILKFLPGKHLKIFPRLQMNAIPFHALRLQGKYLIEHCAAVSYGQTLGLFLENHSAQMRPTGTDLRLIMGEDVDYYELILPKAQQAYGGRLQVERQISWQQLIQSISSNPARDTMFACHGVYDPEDVADSYLQLATKATFERVFEELDLSGRRCAIMGACESGLVRAGIGAEYIGLPSAMLSSGVRYVVGALWKINAMAAAILIDRFLDRIRDEKINVPTALCQSQRELITTQDGEIRSWVLEKMGAGSESDQVLTDLLSLGNLPFAHPYYWAGLSVVGAA